MPPRHYLKIIAVFENSVYLAGATGALLHPVEILISWI